MILMPSDLFLVQLLQDQSINFGSLSFTGDATGSVVPAASMTEGCAFSFGDLANNLGLMKIDTSQTYL